MPARNWFCQTIKRRAARVRMKLPLPEPEREPDPKAGSVPARVLALALVPARAEFRRALQPESAPRPAAQ